MPKPLHIGLLGCGHWGQRILTELRGLDAVVTVCDPDENRRAWALANGAQVASDQYSALQNCQGLIVATPATTHRTVLASVGQVGVPIFVEKPLVTSEADARALLALKLPATFVMHIWRYHPGVRLLGELGRSGVLGELTLLKTIRTNWTSPRTDTDSIWTLAPHDLTIAREILGYFPAPKAAVLERHGMSCRGMTALLGDRPPVVVDVSTRYADKRREIRLHGTKAVAVLASETVDYVDLYVGDDRSTPDERVLERRFFDSTPPLRLELQAFLHYLTGGPAPVSDLAEGIEVIRILEELVSMAT